MSPLLSNSITSQIEIFLQTNFSRCVNMLEKPLVNSFFWKLYFDGSKSCDGAGACCILVNPKDEKTMLTCKLEFKCTKNIVEYEALFQGMYKEICLHVKYLQVSGNSEIVTKEVRNTMH